MKPPIPQKYLKARVKSFRVNEDQINSIEACRELTGMTISRLVSTAISEFIASHIIKCEACEQPMLFRDIQIRGSVKVTCKQCGYTHTVYVE